MDASIYRMRSRDLLTVCVLALLALGAVMVQSASTTLSGAIVRAPAPDPAGPKESTPARPVNLSAAASNDGVDLSWSIDRDPSVVSYRVYRANAVEGEYTLLDTLRKPRSRFHDSEAAKSEPSYYRLTALDAAGDESLPTALTITRNGLWRWTPVGSKQLIYVALSAILFLVVGRVDYRRFSPAAESSALRSPVTCVGACCVGACGHWRPCSSPSRVPSRCFPLRGIGLDRVRCSGRSSC